MGLNDESFFSSLKNVFTVLPTVFASDAAIAITDNENFILFKQAETFELNIQEGMELVSGGVSEKAIKTRKKHSLRYPKEAFGFPIMAYGVPIINPDTNNVVGSITYAVSLEKENEVIEMANELQSFSEELAASSEEFASLTEELADKNENVNNLVNETKEGISSMDDIINYIKSIAETTNLLGLNAAIEAARAGENGRGFSVVAGEIRKLAANSKTSTVQINQALEKIKHNINEIVEVINGYTSANDVQASQSKQIAAESQELSELASKLLKLSENITS
ncbi:chemotaxis protein [Clostridium sp. 19966]|uniref:methyl-accepting chemotaxis protein n=1 Tax=Clostridium sp. 19966 TaxID=2768166 RepID=UPI0028DFFEAE|nr:methyl-accepting chemotaxis protein [Clostridium sp. 19966]MDT8715953.1 chemotaxis protein [Clostridium sp. 19966]